MKVLKGMIVAAMFLTVTTGMAGDLISKLPKSTQVIAKLDLKRLRNSQVFANIEQGNLDKFEQAQEKIAEQIGIDPKSVTSIWLAGVKKKEGMLVLEGNFDAALIRDAVSNKPTCQIVDRDGCELAVFCKKKGKAGRDLAVILDAKTMAIGAPDFIDSFISSYKGKGAALSAENVGKSKAALTKNVFFQGILLGVPIAPQNQGNPIISSIKGGSATLDVTDKITCSAAVTMDSAENAKSATQMLHGLLAMYEMKQQQTQQGEMVKESILKNLKIEQNGTSVNISGGLGEAVLGKLINKVN